MVSFNPVCFSFSCIVRQSLGGSICNAFRVEVGWTSIVLYFFFLISVFNFTARWVSSFMCGKFGGRTLYPCFIICRSALLEKPLFGKLNGASMAIRLGLLFSMFSIICSSV